MVLASFPTSWNLALPEELGSGQWRFCHKITLQHPVVPRRKTDGLSQCGFKAIIPTTLQKKSFLCQRLYQTITLLTAVSYWPLGHQDLWPLDHSVPLHSKSDLWPGHDLLYPSIFLPLLVFTTIVSFFNFIEISSPLTPTPIILLPISPPLESLLSLNHLDKNHFATNILDSSYSKSSTWITKYSPYLNTNVLSCWTLLK